jgi:ATP-dependent exoDNAse (exonuclease V) beta subunit
VTSEFADDPLRARIREELDTTLVVIAGAGTGKTSALVDRIVELVRTGTAPLREIAAITFTEAAAAELRQRVRHAMEEATWETPDDARLVAARDEVDEATICTLHAFAQRILAEHAVAAGIPPGFEVLDDTADHADFDARFSRFADVLLGDPSAERALLCGFAIGLAPEELSVVARSLHDHWDRLEDGGLAAFESRRRSPGEWPEANAASVAHALDAALAMTQWCTDDTDRLLGFLHDVIAPLRAQLATCADEAATLQVLSGSRQLQCSYGQRQNWRERVEEVRDACQAAEDARQRLLQTTRRAVMDELDARLATFVMAVADERRIEGRLGFHDLLVHARRLLRGEHAPTDALRRRYRFLLIDEFQDTDPIQVELAARIASSVDGAGVLRSARPGGVFVVGDPKQSIYRFRRADIETFARVGQEIGEIIVLDTNFRSVPGILAFVNAVFAELFGAEPVPGQAAHLPLAPSRTALSQPPRFPPASARRSSQRPTSGRVHQLQLAGMTAAEESDGGDARRAVRRALPGVPPVTLLGGPRTEQTAEIRRVAARDVSELITRAVAEPWPVLDQSGDTSRPATWRDIAVLVPARSALPALEDAFEASAIPYRLEGVAMLWACDEVRDVLAVLHAAADPADHIAVLAALRSPGLACGDDDLVTWRQAGGDWDPRARVPPGADTHPVARAMHVLAALHAERWWLEPSAMVLRAFEELHSFELCLAYHRPRDHWQRLRWLLDQARLFDETAGGSLRDFLRWAEQQCADERRGGGVGPPDPDDDAVRVMTIHGAKGLEFPVVVVAGLERDTATGHRPPAVLWREDGAPEVYACPTMRSDGYDEMSEREKELDVLEQDRVLYVAMTRARDHLVVCMHHKEGAPTSTTVAARLQEVCDRHRSLWRRPPILEGDREESEATEQGDGRVRADGMKTSVGRHDEGHAEHNDPSGEQEALATWVSQAAAFERRRADALAARRRAPVTTATAVADHLCVPSSRPGQAAARRPAAPPSGEATGVAKRDPDVALRVGRAVHAAVAALDLATGTDAAGRVALEVAKEKAVAHGVDQESDAVVAMVLTALRSPIVREAAAARHWEELYVAVPADDDGGVLEGFVDLVVDAADGLVVVDYKTDAIGSRSDIDAAAIRYRTQVASYALALEAATGRRVCRCVLVFVAGGDPVEYVVEGDALAAACIEAADAARAIVASA